MPKVVFGFTGLIASGKGTVAHYMEDTHHASTYRFSTMLRDILDRIYVPQSRDTMIKLSESLRGLFGEDVMAKTMAHDVEKDETQIILVDGIRRLADIEHLKNLPHFVLVEIFADSELRYQRLTQRGENADDASKTYEQFLEDHLRSTEMTIPDVIALARERINNNGTQEDLHRQLDELVKKYT
jgi:dephospho-CoA kinase